MDSHWAYLVLESPTVEFRLGDSLNFLGHRNIIFLLSRNSELWMSSGTVEIFQISYNRNWGLVINAAQYSYKYFCLGGKFAYSLCNW